MTRGNTIQQAVLALIALVILVPLGIIAVYQATHSQVYSEPQGLEALAGVVITFFFAHGSFLVQAANQAAQTDSFLAHAESLAGPATRLAVSGTVASLSSTTGTPGTSPDIHPIGEIASG